jgi:hypothetical protein
MPITMFAKNDHSKEYKVGILQSTEQVNTGTFISCDHGCMAQSTGHNVHYVVTEEGVYTITSPTSAGRSILVGTLVSPDLPDVHIQWFLDDLNIGDKVLFAAECDKHNNCMFWLPKPDQQGKEYHTTGWFRPRVAATNTTQLCGTGKLSAAVEAQVCSTPAASTPTTPRKYYPENDSSKADPRIEAFRQRCNSGEFKAGRDDFVLEQCEKFISTK